MERKSDKVRRLVKAGDYKRALAIAKDFRIGISKEQSDSMKRGYECMVHPRFFESIGMNTDEVSRDGIETLTELYG